MTDHANPLDDRVDLGLRFFLTGFFSPLALGTVLAVVGFGLTSSGLIVLAGLANLVLLVLAANFLYAGDRITQRIVWYVAPVLLVAAIATIFLGDTLISYLLAAELLMPVIFAAVLTVPTVQAFIAVQRGEALPPPAQAVEFESLLAAAPDGKGVMLRETAKQSAMTYALVLRLVAGLLILLALGGVGFGACIIGGLVPGLNFIDTQNTFTGVAIIFTSILGMPSALVLMVLADSWYFLGTTKGYEKAHLANIIDSSQALVYCVCGAIPVLLLLVILDFFVWVEPS